MALLYLAFLLYGRDVNKMPAFDRQVLISDMVNHFDGHVYFESPEKSRRRPTLYE